MITSCCVLTWLFFCAFLPWFSLCVSKTLLIIRTGFPGGSVGKESTHKQCREHRRWGYDPWVGKIPWRRVWQSAPVFLPGESHEQRRLAGYSPWGHKESDMTEGLIHTHTHTHTDGLLWWLSGKESTCQCRRREFNPWVWKMPWKRKWQPTPVFLPGKSHRQRSLVGYSPWDHRVGHDLSTKEQMHTCFVTKTKDKRA